MPKRGQTVNNQKKSNRTRKPYAREITALFVAIILLFITGILVTDIYFSRNFYIVDVSGRSMEQTIHDGDTVYAARNFHLERGDIVIVDVSEYSDYNGDGEHNIIKRLIAMEGDRVKCEDGVLYLSVDGKDFEPLDEPYVHGENNYEFEEYELKAGEIYVMGDNRPISKDSRSTGPFLAENVIGVVPDWALEIRGFIGFWSRCRNAVTNLFG